MLVGWDADAKRYWAYLLPSKGADFRGMETVVRQVAEEMSQTGYKRIHVRSDGERSLLSMIRLIFRRRGVEVVLEKRMPRDCESHGAVEGAVKLGKGHVRTIKDCIEHLICKEIPPTTP